MDVNKADGISQYSTDSRFADEKKSNDLGKDEFLKLMIAQMNNQNPLQPKENGEFIAQLAQFSTVEGIENMSSGLDSLSETYRSSQVLQASTLVGSAVTVEGNQASQLRWGNLIHGSADVPAGMQDLNMMIQDENGQTIEQVSLGYQPAGELGFKWDGINFEVNGELLEIDYDGFEQDEDGNLIPHAEGSYRFSIAGNYGGEQQALDVATSKQVDSISFDENNEVVLNLSDGERIGIKDVRNINQVI